MHNDSPTISVFWVFASTPVRFYESFRAIATQCQLPGYDNPEEDVLNLSYQWLSSPSSGPWLLIVDNADDLDFVFDRRASPTTRHEFTVSQYLPRRAGGLVLITSRNRTAVFHLLESSDDLVDIQRMTNGEAMALLTKRISVGKGTESDMQELCSPSNVYHWL